jgi:hypothetical protein
VGNTRKLVWIALAGQVLFVVSWVVAGALEPGYSHADQGVSELGARGTEHPWIANAGIVVLGLSFASIGIALRAALPARRASRVATALFLGAAVTIVVAGFARLDCGLSDQRCEDLWRAGQLSWHEDVHLWASFVGQLLLGATPFAIARALWPGPVAPLAVGAGVAGIAIGVASFFLYGVDGAPSGLIQRFGFLVLLVWVVILAVGILHATRPEPRPGQLVRIRPRDFFAHEWSGEGKLVVWPFFLWRRLAEPFDAHRSATWISDNVWRFDDEARYGHGIVRRRRMYCEFVSDERVLITAGDLPEGAEVLIEEDGYRMKPFRMSFPIGPVGVPIRVHDVSYVEPDGTLANVFEARMLVLGLRVARVTFRVRPVVGGAGEATPQHAPAPL